MGYLGDGDMERSKAYDLAIKETINPSSDLLEEEDGVYFNDKYRKSLLQEILKKGFNNEFRNEYNKYYDKENKKKCKMCSIASSSRLCFLKFKDIQGIAFEKIIDNKNVCKPHLDAFDKNTNTYYECKCHEIVATLSVELSPKYAPLLREIFSLTKDQLNKKGKIELDYKDFGINFPLKCGKYFDFKQFICHIIGLITLPDGPKPTLQYVFFKPDEKYMNEPTLKRWNNEFLQVETKLFELLRNIIVYKNGKKELLKDIVNLPDPLIICVSKV